MHVMLRIDNRRNYCKIGLLIYLRKMIDSGRIFPDSACSL